MDSVKTATVDRAGYPDAVTPWEDPDWRAAALDWITTSLAAHGLRTPGPDRIRLRPWSVLIRLPVQDSAVRWFKANPPGSRFEGPLTAALARRVPGHVLTPLAVDAERGWSLLPPGGDLFRDVLARGPVPLAAWERLLHQYAETQRALVPYADSLLTLGVPNARTPELPALFDRLIAGNPALLPEDRRRLRALRPQLVDWSEELAAAGVPDTLDHTDLHDGQLFHRATPGAPPHFTFFDWGDAAVSHPFGCLLVPLRRAAELHGPTALPRLRDAYLEPWTSPHLPAPTLRRAATLAWRLAPLHRAHSYGRFFPTEAATGAPDAARWLLRLADEPEV
ncbi:aminoglycoside phosphotransferase family protein [Streptomyces sp. NPDC047097]|uniref:aminoglycoside phosphotransferase family protein n=1 Tax=Streptomyces sp. NPDC047097 TaxID=3155260 RepID=UPI0033E9CA81